MQGLWQGLHRRAVVAGAVGGGDQYGDTAGEVDELATLSVTVAFFAESAKIG